MGVKDDGTYFHISLVRKKNSEPKTLGTMSLTNKNWIRLMQMADLYNSIHKKSVNESDIMNMMLNTYANKALNRLKKHDKTN